MNRHVLLPICIAVLLHEPLAMPAAPTGAGPTHTLWAIGTPETPVAELALMRAQSQQFSKDGFFVVGRSDAKRDWPRIHPGPLDDWAGERAHTFRILFGIEGAFSGACRLQIRLADACRQTPPWLVIEVNGKEFFQKKIGQRTEVPLVPDGKGRPIVLDIDFSADLLRNGINQISLTTVEGGWLLYDSIALDAPAGLKSAPVADTAVISISSPPGLIERNGQASRAVEVCFHHFGKPVPALIKLNDMVATNLTLAPGIQTGHVLTPAPQKQSQVAVTVEVDAKIIAALNVTLDPVRKLTVYILPHSHTDIGFTDIQTAIEKKQVNNLLQAIRYARKTAAYPNGARFIWNVEVLWAADLYLNRLSEGQRAEFFDAVKLGQVALNGMYLNVLTGLCRPEELVELFRYSTKLADQCGVTVDSAMISDVPGYTWGTVTAMAQAGIKYFSVAPNWFDRIGDTQLLWENKAFYWLSPSGKEKLLVWLPNNGYGLANRTLHLSDHFVRLYQTKLEKAGYPYDVSYIRWCGHGDNALPDPTICDFVRDWNAQYTWPRFVIASTSEAFRALEQRHGPMLPQVRGDWTPYWEDGAGSSAFETALNRASAEALVQAQSLWAILNPSSYPAADFERAWKNILLYSEHTWGANCSVSAPEDKRTVEQWAIKQSYALDGYKQSAGSLRPRTLGLAGPSGPGSSLDVWNTTSWPRTELVCLTNVTGDQVVDDRGERLSSQRVAGGLAVRIKDVPPFAARRLTLSSGASFCVGQVMVNGPVLDNGILRVRVDEKTGAIAELRAQGIDCNLVDSRSGEGLNDYLYLVGNNLADLQRNGPVKISAGETGPLLASLIIESGAPGCHTLTRELRLAAGNDFVELINTLDKKRLETANYSAQKGKESVNFAFPFQVPGGQILLDIPLGGAIRPELDQMPGACKNWLTVGRWADVFNNEFGVTWVTLDAPLIELGGITATLLNAQSNPAIWRHKIEPTQKLYSWAMNNHWKVNYRAYQEGVVRFRYILRPHHRSSPADAARLATGFSQPLLVRVAAAAPPQTRPRLTLSSPDILVTGFKPGDDGRSLILRLFGASGKTRKTTLTWSDPQPKRICLSSTAETAGQELPGEIEVPGNGLVTLRAEFAE